MSLGTILLWLSLHSDTESLSITELAFVHAKSALSLCVIKQPDASYPTERLIRVDKDQQFEWLLTDDSLEKEAIHIMDTGLSAWFYPAGDHLHGRVGPNCEFELYFERSDVGQPVGCAPHTIDSIAA